MLAPNLLLSFQISMTPPFSPLVVRVHCRLSRISLSHSCVIDAQHRFIAEECDWGFTRFSELRKLFHTQENHSRPTIEDDAADITVYVRVLEDPTGVLWHNFVK